MERFTDPSTPHIFLSSNRPPTPPTYLILLHRLTPTYLYFGDPLPTILHFFVASQYSYYGDPPHTVLCPLEYFLLPPSQIFILGNPYIFRLFLVSIYLSPNGSQME